MDRNTITGFLLIFGVLILWQYLTGPTQGEIVEQQRIQDSIAQAQVEPDLQGREGPVELDFDTTAASLARTTAEFGVFAPERGVTVRNFTLENEVLRLTFNNLGGRLVAAELKAYDKLDIGPDGEELRTPVVLLADEGSARFLRGGSATRGRTRELGGSG